MGKSTKRFAAIGYRIGRPPKRFGSVARQMGLVLKNPLYIIRAGFVVLRKLYRGSSKIYHLINAEPQVKPAPNAARHRRSPSFILPCSQASHSAIGTEAAVVLPYFWILLNT